MSARGLGALRFGNVLKAILAASVAPSLWAASGCGSNPESPPSGEGSDASAPETGAPSHEGGQSDGATSDSAADSSVADASDDGPVIPTQACMTHYLDPAKYTGAFADPAWYAANIPYLDVPDGSTGSHIQSVYYYRWSTLKRALRYTDAANGYVFLEFLEPPGYAAAFGAVNAAAGHHLYEARWLHDPRYGDDYLNYWLNGAGQPGIREYSFWVADSAWARYQVSGDAAFVKGLLTPLMKNYDAWDDHFDKTLGLYWQVPVWDAMEYMADSYSPQNPDHDAYHGGTGFRPTLNAYQYADALAIASIAGDMLGDASTAATYKARAQALVTAMETNLWSSDSNFFVHKYRDGGALFSAGGGREEIGLVPWQFHMPTPGHETAWRDTIMSPASFFTAYGPRTVEKSNPYYLYSYKRGECCHWNGPLWPYATTQTLKAMANLLNDYAQSFVTRADYFTLLEAFAKSQFKNGEPYIAEALDPDDATGAPVWAYDSPGHSEHYNHSGFVDPVITGLIGFHPSAEDRVRVSPLTPAAWDHFMLENVLYHGRYLTFVWDADGAHYQVGKGFRIFEDCTLIHQQPALGAVDVPLVGGARAVTKAVRRNNLFGNAANADYPKATASYTFGADDVAQVNDGIVLYDRSVGGSPNNVAVHNRWTNYNSTTSNGSDWVQIDLGSAKTLREVTLHVYDDGAGVVPPAAYIVSTSADGVTWMQTAHPTMLPVQPAAGPNVAKFDAVTARYVRVTFTVSPKCATGGGGCAGLTELEAWAAP